MIKKAEGIDRHVCGEGESPLHVHQHLPARQIGRRRSQRDAFPALDRMYSLIARPRSYILYNLVSLIYL